MGSCPSCARELPGEFPFCPYCGSRIDAAPAQNLERKVVTALFCDLVGSTAAAEGADPEDVRARLGTFHHVLRRRLESFGGTVEKFAGDAVLAVFGAPVAHEDDAERAVRAGLSILDELAALNGRDPSLALHVRIGVNTGESVVDLTASSGQGDAFVFGDVVNTAARLQSAAPVDAVVVGEQTRRTTERVVEYEPLDPVAAKGKAEPLALWRAVRARSRVGVDVIREVASPMVGRAQELERLVEAFDRCRSQRHVELVTVVGDPGVGKSRLVAELFAHTDARPELVTWRQGRCLPYGEGITYWALGEIVKAQAGIDDADDTDVATAKLVRIVPPGDDHERLLARLLPLLGIEGAPASPVDSHRAWRELLEHVASTGPLVVVVEDLHWADDALLAFLEGLVAEGADVPMLVVGTARPGLLERHPGWTGGAERCSLLRLDRLSDHETSRLVAALLDQVLLPAETQSAILERAAGNPLYAEEFVRLLRDGDLLDERGRLREGAEVPVPDGVQALIAARLDGLDTRDKRVLQAAAVVGKVFSAAEVAGALEQDAAGLAEVLERLNRQEYVRASRRTSGDAALEFSFWHVLVRDVAYAGLARSPRARMHAAFTAWLSTLSDRPEDVAEIAAHHAEEALALARSLGDEVLAEAMERHVRRQSLLAGEHLLALDVVAAERYLARARELTPVGADGWIEVSSLHARALFGVRRFAECCDVAMPVWDEVEQHLSLLDSPVVFAGLIDARNASFRSGRGWDPDMVGLLGRYVSTSASDSAGRVAASAYLANHMVLRMVDEQVREGLRLSEQALADSRRLQCWSSLSECTTALARAMLGDEGSYREVLVATRRTRETEVPTYAVVAGAWGVMAASYWEGPVAALAIVDELIAYERARHLDIVGSVVAPVMHLVPAGRLDEARRLLEARIGGGEIPADIADEVVLAEALGGPLTADARRSATALVRRVDDLPNDAALRSALEDLLGLRVQLAEADLSAGDREAASAWMAEVPPTLLARRRNFVGDITRAARVWRRLGRIDELRELGRELPRHTPWEQLNARVVDALLADTDGDQFSAANQFSAVAERWRAFGDRVEEVRAVLDEGRILGRLGQPSAEEVLRRARGLAQSMGAAALVGECDAELAVAERATS